MKKELRKKIYKEFTQDSSRLNKLGIYFNNNINIFDETDQILFELQEAKISFFTKHKKVFFLTGQEIQILDIIFDIFSLTSTNFKAVQDNFEFYEEVRLIFRICKKENKIWDYFIQEVIIKVIKYI